MVAHVRGCGSRDEAQPAGFEVIIAVRFWVIGDRVEGGYSDRGHLTRRTGISDTGAGPGHEQCETRCGSMDSVFPFQRR